MEFRVEALRSELEVARAGRRRWRCPPSLRERVVAFARDEIESRGRSLYGVAKDLGLSCSSLARWLRRDRPVVESRSRFRPVHVVAEGREQIGHLTLVTPAGYRVEGLTIAAVAGLLARL
jgi:hypothetical protein